DREPRWQQPGRGQLGDRWHQQAAGQITGGSEKDHSLDHTVPPFSGGSGPGSRSGKGAGGGGTPANRGEGGPVTPGRQRKIAPAWGWAARLSGSQSNQEVVMYRSPRSVPPKATEVGLVAGSSITPSRVPSARQRWTAPAR